MPFVDITLIEGKSDEYIAAVLDAVHRALVEGWGMQDGDRFQAVHELPGSRLEFARDFRGGPRSDDFITFVITAGPDKGSELKGAFYKRLVELLGENPGVRPEDVLVMMHNLPVDSFSFASGELIASDTIK